MHIKNTVVTDKAKTFFQWAKLGMKPKEGVEGVEAWSNGYCVCSAYYYEPNEVEPMTDQEKAEFKAEEKKKRDIAKQNREEKQRRIEQHCKIMENWRTAVQWLTMGYVPNQSANWELGEDLNGKDYCSKGSSYYYCHIKDVAKDEEKAKEILETYNKAFENCNYDGRSWW